MENSKAIATCRGSKYEVVLKQHFDNGDWAVTYVDGGVRASFSESELSVKYCVDVFRNHGGPHYLSKPLTYSGIHRQK